MMRSFEHRMRLSRLASFAATGMLAVLMSSYNLSVAAFPAELGGTRRSMGHPCALLAALKLKYLLEFA